MNTPPVIFDLDDTLTDTSAALREAWQRIIAEAFGERVPVDAGLLCWQAAAEWFAPGDVASALACIAAWHRVPIERNRQSHEWLDRLEELELQSIGLFPPMTAVLKMLRAQGTPIGIVTNGRVIQQRAKYRRLELSRWIDEAHFLVCDGTQLPHKPSPDGIHAVARRLGASRPLVVGDRRSDIIAGFLAGCPTIRVTCPNRVARQGDVWLGTIGDPDIAMTIEDFEATFGSTRNAQFSRPPQRSIDPHTEGGRK